MNAAEVNTTLEQFALHGRAACRAQVAYRERTGPALTDQDISAIASWFHPLSSADVRRALFVRWLLESGRLAGLAEGN